MGCDIAPGSLAEKLYNSGVPRMTRCRKVLFHSNPHLDEVGQIWLAEEFASTHFPGIEDAEWVFNTLPGPFMGKSWQQLWLDGWLPLGSGGGPLDEHQMSAGKARIQGQCGMTLVADFVGRREDPALKRLLDYVLGNDEGGKRDGHFDLAATIRTNYWYGGLTQERAVAKAAIDFGAWYRQQQAFLACGPDLLAKQKAGLVWSEKIQVGNQMVGCVAVDKNENREMASYLRHMGVQVVLLRSPRGNVQIFWPKFLVEKPAKVELDMREVVRVVRIREAQVSGKTLTGDPTAEGYVSGAECWYYTGWALLNASDSYPDTPPAKVSFGDIVKVVRACMRLK